MIAITNLVKHHGTLRVLDHISLTISKGEIAVVIGPSGGGKSTLLRCINGLESFDEGQVEVDGLVLHPHAVDESTAVLVRLRQRVGMVFQQFHLFPHMTVLDNVLSGPRFAMGQRGAESEKEAFGL